ncbi:MAG: CoxG family protein [Bacillota bacterium]
MRVSGSFTYDAPPAVVYRLFTDKEALLFATPGLVSLEEVQPDRYEAVLTVGIGGFALVYRGALTVTDREPDRAYRLLVDAQTHNGFGKGEARFRFLPLAGDRCRVEYEADVELGGAQKLLPSLARGLVDFFLRGMAEALAQRVR